MIIVAYMPALFALLGLLIWILATNPILKEVGKILFFCGWLVTNLTLAKYSIHLGT